MPDKTPVEDVADDDIIDLLEVVKPGKPVAPESGDDVDFSADLDSMLAELAKHETGEDQDTDQPFPDPTPVDHEVDPNEKLDLPSMEDLDHLLETLGATAEEEGQTEEVPTGQGDDLDAVSLEERDAQSLAGESESTLFAETNANGETDTVAEAPQPAGEPPLQASPPALTDDEPSPGQVFEQGEEAKVAGLEPPPANGLEANVFDAFETALAAVGDEADRTNSEAMVSETMVSETSDSEIPPPEIFTESPEAALQAPVADMAEATVAASSDITVDLDDLPFAKTAAPNIPPDVPSDTPSYDPFEAAMAADAEQALDAETIAAALDDAGLPGDSPVDPFDAVIAGQGATAVAHPDLSDPVNVTRAAAEEMEELRVEATEAPGPLADDLASDLPGDFQSDLSAFPSTPEDDSPADPFEAALAADIADEHDAHIVAAALDENGQSLVAPPGDPFEAAMALQEELAAPEPSHTAIEEETAEPADTAAGGQTGTDEVAPQADDTANMEQHAQETPVDQTAGEAAETRDEATNHLEEVDLNELDALLDDMLSTAPPAGDQPVVPAVQEKHGKSMEERVRFLEERLAAFVDTAGQVERTEDQAEALRELQQKLLVSQGELVEQEMAPLQTALANAQALMTEIRQELADKEAVIAELKGTLEAQAGMLENMKSEVSAGDSRYAALEERFTLLETDLDKKAAAAAAKVIREEIAALLQSED